MNERRYTEAEVEYQILEIWPELGEHAGYVLWNHTCFPFPEGDDPLAFWIKQVEEYMEEHKKEEASLSHENQ